MSNPTLQPQVARRDVGDLVIEEVDPIVINQHFMYNGEQNGSIKITNNRTTSIGPGVIGGTHNGICLLVYLSTPIAAGDNETNWAHIYGISMDDDPDILNITLGFHPTIPV